MGAAKDPQLLKGHNMSMRSMVALLGLTLISTLQAQMWQQNDNIFNPSGIPSLPFSQPRFADLDNDGDQDMVLGSISDAPLYFENTGSASNPSFQQGDDLFIEVSELDCEVGVCVDLDSDGDLDFVAGGYNGLQLYDNTGDASNPAFELVSDFFSGVLVGANPIPHLADMDNDDDLDLVVGISESGDVRYYQNFGTPSSAIFMEAGTETWFDVGLYAYPWFSDMDDDGDTDLLVGRDGYGFYYYQNVGTNASWTWIQASSQFSGLGGSTYWNSPCLVDLTGDGKKDLVHGTASGPLKYYRNSGSLTAPTWSEVSSLFGGVIDVGGASNPVFIDFDQDGDQDMLTGTQMGDIKYYENTGSAVGPAWTANHSLFSNIDHSIYSAIGVGDLNGDGLIDLAIGDLSGNLYYYLNTGTGFSYQSNMFSGISAGGWSCPRFHDMDDDQDLDLILGREDGQISYFENTGSTSAAEWTEDATLFSGIDIGSNAVPTFGDINLDGNLDMIVGESFRDVSYFSYDNGSWIEMTDSLSEMTVGQNAAPALADLDGDGDLDLTVGNYDGTFNYWEGHAIVGIHENELKPTSSRLLPAYPNPFNPETQIRFELNKTGMVSLRIFDLSGRLVNSIVNAVFQEGYYQYMWDGSNYQGMQLDAGLYLVVLESDGDMHTQKVTLLK